MMVASRDNLPGTSALLIQQAAAAEFQLRLGGGREPEAEQSGRVEREGRASSEREQESGAVQISARLHELAARAAVGVPSEAQRKVFEGEYERLKMELAKMQRTQAAGEASAAGVDVRAVEDALRKIEGHLNADGESRTEKKGDKKARGDESEPELLESEAKRTGDAVKGDADQSLAAQANIPGEDASELLEGVFI